jgi:hypothetical protein
MSENYAQSSKIVETTSAMTITPDDPAREEHSVSGGTDSGLLKCGGLPLPQ